MGIFNLFSSGKKEDENFDEIRCLKTIADAQAVLDGLQALSRSGQNFDTYKHSIDSLFKQLIDGKTGFVRHSYPIELKINNNNKAIIASVCAEFQELLQKVRIFAVHQSAAFPPEQQDLLVLLMLENPGDYYEAINNPQDKVKLMDHPFREKIESLSLQDLSFEYELVEWDESFWEIWKYSPNVKAIHLFGADLVYNNLASMELNLLNELKVLVLSENSIDELPKYFSSMTSLIYLDLSENPLTALPDDLSAWKNLKYLNLEDTDLEEDELERIKMALPQAKIVF